MDLAQTMMNRGLLSQEQLAQSRETDSVITWMMTLPSVDKDKVLKAAAEEYDVDYIDLQNSDVDLSLLENFPQKLIYRASLFPISAGNGSIRIATADPLDFYPLDEVAAATGLNVVPVFADPIEINKPVSYTHLRAHGDRG